MASISDSKTAKKPVSEIQTRPLNLTSKRGTTGTKLNLQANYFKLKSQTDWCLYQYRVDISPDEERTIVRKSLLRAHKEILGAYLFDGTVLYTNNRLPQPLELDSIRNEDRVPLRITIRLVGDLVRGDFHYFQVFNLIIRRCLEHLQLQLVGRNYFDAERKIEIREYKLELWPGYITSIRQHEQNVLMSTEISHKVMRDQTLYNLMMDCYTRTPGQFQDIFKRTVIGNVVLTDYNNRTYRIDDVDFSMNPSKTFKLRDGTNISYAVYYRQKYQITVRDVRQPLLLSRSTARDRRAGKDELVYLIPELCRSTGLTDSMRNDFRLMKALADHTRIGPDQRIKRLLDFNLRLRSKPEICKEFNDWNFHLEQNLIQLPGRKLPDEELVFGQGKIVKVDKGDWNFKLHDQKAVSVGELKNWVAIVPIKYSAQAKIFLDRVIRCGGKMGFQIQRPTLFEISNDRNDSYNTNITKVTDSMNPQLILCVVANNNLERYSLIKKKLCIDRPIPSQVVLARTLTQKTESMLTSVGFKVAVQLNCKLGGIPWSMAIGTLLPGLMIVGFDVCHSKSKNGDFGAMVASLDQHFGRYFSAVSKHTVGEELSNDLALHLGRAIQEFKTVNQNRLPSRIIIYRDGVGEGQIPFVYDYELCQIKKKLGLIYGGSDKFKLGFIVVTKRINTRLFFNNKNPPSGTVVDDVITDPLKYDFFVVSQCVTQGTVAPTAYNVIDDNTGLPPDRIQLLTYKLCHMYYNFTGTVRVPAPCQYAHKLAFFVSQSLHQPPHTKLEKLLYFL